MYARRLRNHHEFFDERKKSYPLLLVDRQGGHLVLGAATGNGPIGVAAQPLDRLRITGKPIGKHLGEFSTGREQASLGQATHAGQEDAQRRVVDQVLPHLKLNRERARDQLDDQREGDQY